MPCPFISQYVQIHETETKRLQSNLDLDTNPSHVPHGWIFKIDFGSYQDQG